MPKAQQVEFLLAGVRDTNGSPLSAGLVYSYDAGTTNDRALYSASDKGTSHAQGVALDAYGRLQAWADGAYKIVIKTAAGVTLYTFDNVVYGYDDGELKWGGTSGGTGNAQTVTISSVTALTSGLRVIFIAGASNSGATTLNVSGLGAVAIKRLDGTTALSTNDILSGDIVDVIYDTGAGGRFRMLNPAPNRTAFYGGASGGSANAQTITVSPSISGVSTGMTFDFYAGFNNTGSTTLNVNGTGAVTIYKDNLKALEPDDLIAGLMYRVIYYSASYFLVGRTDDRRMSGTGTAVTIASSSGETSLYLVRIPANTLGLTRALRFTCLVKTSNTSGSALSATFRLKYGSTTQVTDTATYSAIASGSSPQYTKFECIIQAGGATNAQRILYHALNNFAAVGVPATAAGFACYQDGTIDMTAFQDLEFTAQLNVVSANATCVMKSAFVEFI